MEFTYVIEQRKRKPVSSLKRRRDNSMSDWPIRIMVYGAGEAAGGAGALSDQIQMQLSRLQQVITTQSVAGIAQLESSSAQSLRYVLDPQGRQPFYQIPNVNVGDPNSLLEFVKWSAAVCPAQCSVLALSGHGAAWEDEMVAQTLGRAAATNRAVHAARPAPGAIHHPRSLFGPNATPHGAMGRAILIDGQNRDFLSNAELGSALAQIRAVLGGKIDVLVFDACLMSSWEILQEVSDSATTVVGSVDEISASGIDLSAAAAKLNAANGAATPMTIAVTIATEFQPQTVFDSCVAVDLSSTSWVSALTA